MSMLSQAFYVIIYHGISITVNGIEVVDGINNIEKRFIFKLISTVKLPGANSYDTQMVMQTGTRTSNVSFAKVF